MTREWGTGTSVPKNKNNAEVIIKNGINIPVERQAQRSLFRHGLRPAKTGCWYSTMMMMVSVLAGKTIDQNDIWDEAVKYKYIDPENAEVKNPSGLAKLAGINASWTGKLNAEKEKIKEQLKKANVVQIILSDGHSEIINGYKIENGILLFTVVDPGYQGDKIIDSQNMEAHISYPDKHSSAYGEGNETRHVKFFSFFIVK